LTQQLALGLKCLNDLNIVHRDLKPQNILVQFPDHSNTDPNTANLKISDFGFARFLDDHIDESTASVCGSPLYMAPEIFICGHYGAKVDLYSTGAIILEMLTGRTPYHLRTYPQIYQAHKREERNPVALDEWMIREVSPLCISLIRGLLEKSPYQRINFPEFFHHPWLNLGPELLQTIEQLYEDPPSPAPVVVPTPKATAPPVGTCSLMEANPELLETLRSIEQALITIDEQPYASLFEQRITVDSLREFASRVSTFSSKYTQLAAENKRLDARQQNSIAIQEIEAGDQVMFHGHKDKPYSYKAYNPATPHYISPESIGLEEFSRVIAAGRVIFGHVVEVVPLTASAGNPYGVEPGRRYCEVVIAPIAPK